MADAQQRTSTDRADGLVLFGLTGDLGEKKLFPALAELARSGDLDGPVIGVGRREMTDDDLWNRFVEAIDADSASTDDLDSLRSALDLHYVSGDSEDADTYDRIGELLDGAQRPVVYAALPPDLFERVAEGVSRSLPASTRLVVEKPFGQDEASAVALHDRITRSVDADRLFIVDHFLAKSVVENLSAFRRVNPMVEAAFRQGPVKRIEITMAEDFGLEGRGSFYESVGVVGDVLQSHLLQTVAALLMEPVDPDEPSTPNRAALLSSIRPVDPEWAVLGQYEGYTELDDVDHDSRTATFVAARLEVDNERWGGVEVFVRTGKKMHATYTECVVVFSDDGDVADAPGTRLRFQLKPNSAIAMETAVLDPTDHGFAPTTLWGCAPAGHAGLGDYATMLRGAILGDRQHFASIDSVVAAWNIVAPLLSRSPDIHRYHQGSQGPALADELLGDQPWIDGPITPDD